MDKLKKDDKFAVKESKKTVEDFLRFYHKENDSFFLQFFSWSEMICDEHQSIKFKNCVLNQPLPYFISTCPACQSGKENGCTCDDLFYPIGTKMTSIEFDGLDNGTGTKVTTFTCRFNDSMEQWFPEKVVGKFMSSYEVEEKYGAPMPYYMI
jgi:hypothetical protein